MLLVKVRILRYRDMYLFLIIIRMIIEIFFIIFENIFENIVTVNHSKVDGKMLNIPIRYSFFEFSIKIFTF